VQVTASSSFEGTTSIETLVWFVRSGGPNSCGTSGGVESTSHEKTAVFCVARPWSATTVSACDPSARPERLTGEAHDATGVPSTSQVSVAAPETDPMPVTVKWMLAVVSFETAPGSPLGPNAMSQEFSEFSTVHE